MLNNKVYKLGIINRVTNRNVRFMLPGNTKGLPDDFDISKERISK